MTNAIILDKDFISEDTIGDWLHNAECTGKILEGSFKKHDKENSKDDDIVYISTAIELDEIDKDMTFKELWTVAKSLDSLLEIRLETPNTEESETGSCDGCNGLGCPMCSKWRDATDEEYSLASDYDRQFRVSEDSKHIKQVRDNDTYKKETD